MIAGYVIPLQSAISIANTAHYGQTDKNGEAYVLHPIRVMLRAKTIEERIVALLHDVVEDTRDKPIADRWTLERLAKHFPDDAILSAVDAITRRRVEVLDRKGYPRARKEAYEDYIARVAQHRIARRVKLADLADNLDPRRWPRTVWTDDQRRRQQRYTWALDYLKKADAA